MAAESVNVYEAKTHLSKLLDRVLEGEEIILSRNGRPVARLVPMSGRIEPRVPGAWQGRVHIAPDFDELPDEIAAAFRGQRP